MRAFLPDCMTDVSANYVEHGVVQQQLSAMQCKTSCSITRPNVLLQHSPCQNDFWSFLKVCQLIKELLNRNFNRPAVEHVCRSMGIKIEYTYSENVQKLAYFSFSEFLIADDHWMHIKSHKQHRTQRIYHWLPPKHHLHKWIYVKEFAKNNLTSNQIS